MHRVVCIRVVVCILLEYGYHGMNLILWIANDTNHSLLKASCGCNQTDTGPDVPYWQSCARGKYRIQSYDQRSQYLKNNGRPLRNPETITTIHDKELRISYVRASIIRAYIIYELLICILASTSSTPTLVVCIMNRSSLYMYVLIISIF